MLWTSDDKERLKNVDRLHTRLLEYHNNVHSRSRAQDDAINDRTESISDSFGIRQGLSLFDGNKAASIINPVATHEELPMLTYVGFYEKSAEILPVVVKNSNILNSMTRICHELQRK